MALRFNSVEELGNMSPALRAQVERELKGQRALEQARGLDAAVLPAAPKKRARPEQEAGEQLIQWVQLLPPLDGMKPWDVFYHVPNGGFRNPVEARIFYGQGVRAGWPDYGLDMPRGGYHGLRLELKAGDNTPSTEQLEILSNLERQGYFVKVAWGFEEAKDAIERYLALDP